MVLWWTLLGCTDFFGGGAKKGPPLLADFGVDVAAKRLRLGALNDESGPAKAIGRPWAIGKRVLLQRVNRGETELLPEGWTIELVERDHGYDTERAKAALDEIRDEVLFVTTSFGTAQTLALRDTLVEADLVAFPASVSTALVGHPLTPPLGATYDAQARRAVDYVVENADGGEVRLAVVYQDDAFGQDVLAGAKTGAQAYGLSLALSIPLQSDQDATVAAANADAALVDGDITHAVLGTLPPVTSAILDLAMDRDSVITWVGTTPSWSDRFAAEPRAAQRLARYVQTSSLPFWGEDVPGMTEFERGFRAYGGGAQADGYVLNSYVQGLVQLEAASTAIEAGDITRAGFRRALRQLRTVDAGGMLAPMDLSRMPGPVTDQVRILKPRIVSEGPRFEQVLPARRPGPRRERPGQAAIDDEANAGANPGEATEMDEDAPGR